MVEGAADRNLYKRIYPEAKIIQGGSCYDITQTIKEFNRTIGQTPLVAGIIDRDLKTDEEIEILSKENIFVLGEREIESIFLREDIVRELFGEQVFQKFIIEICNDASKRTSTQITDYNQALIVLKKEVSSKFSIRMLLKIAGKKNRGNDKNIDLLCKMMDEKNAWDLIKHIFPDIYGNCIDNRFRSSQTEKFHKQLQDFKENSSPQNILTEATREPQGEKEL